MTKKKFLKGSMKLTFEWDEDKVRENLKKHKSNFEEGSRWSE